MPDIKNNNSQNKSSLRFNNLRAAHQTELAEDYVEMIYELINEKGEARAVDLASRFGVSNPTVNASIQRLQTIGNDWAKVELKLDLYGCGCTYGIRRTCT